MRRSVLLIPIFFALILVACEEEEECVGCNLNPKVKIKFEAITTRPYIDSVFNAIVQEISANEDSLELELSVAERSEIESALVGLREDSSSVGEDYSILRTGSTRLDVLEAQGSEVITIYQDTIVRDFAFPVDMEHDTSVYYFSYHGFTDTLLVSYQRDIVQTFDGVRMRISDIGVDKEFSTFDSVRVKCYNTECSNDLTTIFVYF